MKENLELVEKLVEKTGLSYTEAKIALEKADWDILEAIINLESEGRVKSASSYSTRTESEQPKQEQKEEQEARYEKKKNPKAEEYKKTTIGVLEWLRSVFDKGNTNNIELYKNGDRVLGMPVTVFVILCLVSFGTVLVLMLISLFFGVRYRFSGPDLGKDNINKAMGKATDVADSIKSNIKNAAEKNAEDDIA